MTNGDASSKYDSFVLTPFCGKHVWVRSRDLKRAIELRALRKQCADTRVEFRNGKELNEIECHYGWPEAVELPAR